MRAEDLIVEVRTRTMTRVGQITAPFLNLEARVKWCGVGSWSLTLPGNHPMVPHLQTPGSGIVVSGPVGSTFTPGTFGQGVLTPVVGTIFSGPTRAPRRVRNSKNPDGTYTFTGLTDEEHLNGARAFPDPLNADPSTQAVANDERTGTAESLMRQFVAYNIGNGAIADTPTSWAPAGRLRGSRQYIALKGGSLNRGLTLTKSPRFQNLIELLREIVAYDPSLGFRMRQEGSRILFAVEDSRDLRSSVRFDVTNGTIQSEEVMSTGPTLTDAFVAGQGEGTARTIVRRNTAESLAAETDWGLVYESFIDQRDTDDLTELQQSGDEALMEARGGTSVKVVPTDDFTMQYGLHWREGDLVAVVTDGVEGVAIVTETVILANSDGVAVGAAIGDVSGFSQKDAEAAKVQSIDQRVSNLERASAGPVEPERIPQATETARGGAEFATLAETLAWADGTRMVSPLVLGQVNVASRNTVIGPTADWNTIGPGVYQVNDGSGAGANYPSGVYGFGTLVVFKSGYNQVTQVYFPHNSGGAVLSRTPVTRTKFNASDWGSWMRFVPDASETVAGIAEVASAGEVAAGVDTTRFVTPARLGDDTGWADLPLASGFTHTASNPMQYRRRRGEVFLRGRLDGTPTSGQTFGTLPVGFRPPTTTLLAGTRTSNTNQPTPLIRVDISASGDLIAFYGTVTTAPTWIGVHGSFLLD